MKRGAQYLVTAARVSPHNFVPGTVVRYTGQDNADRQGRWPAHRWLFKSADGIVQWLAAEDVEEVR